jgi:glutamate carboxypeptidase
MGHLDTVFPRDHAFQRLTRGGDTWRGPGVSDMKGGIVTALLALALMPLDEASFRLVLASDEEIGSPTALPVIQDAAQGIDLALCFEAARPCGGLVIARKGYGSARVAVEGRGGHAGIAHDTSVNAFTALARVVLAAEALEQDGVTVSPGGAVRVAPAAVNAIPERAECELEWRFETAASGEATLRALRAIAVEGARVTMDAHIECPPMAVDARSDRVLRCYVEAARGLGMDVRGVATAGVGDINHVAHLGAACLDGVGPEGGGFHTEDEHVVVDSIARRAAMTATALPRYLSELRAR